MLHFRMSATAGGPATRCRCVLPLRLRNSFHPNAAKGRFLKIKGLESILLESSSGDDLEQILIRNQVPMGRVEGPDAAGRRRTREQALLAETLWVETLQVVDNLPVAEGLRVNTDSLRATFSRV